MAKWRKYGGREPLEATIKVLINEEYGYAYHLWEYPGTADELIADWQAGRTPFSRPIIASMPPKYDYRHPKPHYRGELTSYLEDDGKSVQDQVLAKLYVDCDGRALELNDGRVVPCPMQPPTAEQIANGDISALAKSCISAADLSQILSEGPAPRVFNWLMAHFMICSSCANKFAQARPGTPIKMWDYDY